MSAFADRSIPTTAPAPPERGPASSARRRTRIMGILNVTPDSFSDGGRYIELEDAVGAALAMHADGADIIDVGGESTRPGADPVSVSDELARVIPVIEAIGRGGCDAISIDTSKPRVMTAAVQAGATMINDVTALGAKGALEVARDLGVAVCLMHMQGEPRTMQSNPRYDDVVAEVRDFLLSRVETCVAAGIDADRLLIDPGFGFGKTLEHNLALLANLDVLVSTGVPVVVGLSRKSMIARMLDRPVEGRAAASAALALLAAQKGASVVRVHDVADTADALNVAAWVQWADERGRS